MILVCPWIIILRVLFLKLAFNQIQHKVARRILEHPAYIKNKSRDPRSHIQTKGTDQISPILFYCKTLMEILEYRQ